MGVPILYQGSQYYPGIPPSKQYPAFSAAEVGNVNASTVAVTFSVDVSASNYATGVTIKVNGSAATISSATRQSNHAIVYYILSAAVVNGDAVTWEYSGGNIINEATGAALQTTSAQSVTNNVAPGIPPQFSTAEIGTVNASTVAVTFDKDVSASNYATGVTIKVNGTATSITSATRQADHAVVYYVIPVLWHGSGDAVTWEYASGSGNIIAELGGGALSDVAAQSVTNNCEYAALLDLQADTLALNDGDPVSTWADQSGNNRNFTQTGTARPTKQTAGGYTAIKFDGSNDYLQGSNFADNLPAFTVIVCSFDTGNSTGHLITKYGDSGSSPDNGWSLDPTEEGFSIYGEDGADSYVVFPDGYHYDRFMIVTAQKVSNSEMHLYYDQSNLNEQTVVVGTVLSFSNSYAVAIGIGGIGGITFTDMQMRAAMIFAPNPNATNRAALEARLAARYGVTL